MHIYIYIYIYWVHMCVDVNNIIDVYTKALHTCVHTNTYAS